MRPREFHEWCGGEVVGNPRRCLKCSHFVEPRETYTRTVLAAHTREPHGMTREQYVAWKAEFFGISLEEADRSVWKAR